VQNDKGKGEGILVANIETKTQPHKRTHIHTYAHTHTHTHTHNRPRPRLQTSPCYKRETEGKYDSEKRKPCTVQSIHTEKGRKEQQSVGYRQHGVMSDP